MAAALGLSLGRLTDAIAPAVNAEILPTVSVKDIMDKAEAERAAKKAAKAALPQRPTELRDRCACLFLLSPLPSAVPSSLQPPLPPSLLPWPCSNALASCDESPLT